MSNTGVILTKYPMDMEIRIDHRELREFCFLLDEVSITWYEGEGINMEMIRDQIRINKISRLVIAGFFPGYTKDLVADSLLAVNETVPEIILASYSDHGLNGGTNTEMAKKVILCAIKGIAYERVAIPEALPGNPETLVIGGGIAGIQASLEIANGGFKVHLLEKTGTIGGHMAMFDKTFPTLDCAACILTPKMVEVGQHQNIELHAYAEVVKVEGKPGDFKVTVRKKARRVDIKSCISCGICSDKCPVKVSSEFDAGTQLRKAIYIPFPQAVPNKYLIDEANCRYVQEEKCGVCAKVCPASCIDLDQKDSEEILEVGNIILATGFQAFDAARIERFGYGKYPNVLTSIEFERLVNASGPSGGNITFRKQDKKGNWVFTPEGDEPKSVALIHCVGSRDHNYHSYCSRVCCMYSLKMAHLVKEKIPEADVFEYYIDMRAFGKGYEEFYERIKEEGVNIIRGKTATIEQEGDLLLLRSEDIIQGKIIEQKAEMVVLSVGLEPRKDSGDMARMLGIESDHHGWFLESSSTGDNVGTCAGGVFIAGACQGPKDIPDSVVQGSAAAAKVLQNLSTGKVRTGQKEITIDQIMMKIDELTISQEVSK